MSSYIDIDQLKLLLEIAATDTDQDDILELAIAAASDGIDNATGRKFSLSDAHDASAISIADAGRDGAGRGGRWRRGNVSADAAGDQESVVTVEVVSGSRVSTQGRRTCSPS